MLLANRAGQSIAQFHGEVVSPLVVHEICDVVRVLDLVRPKARKLLFHRTPRDGPPQNVPPLTNLVKRDGNPSQNALLGFRVPMSKCQERQSRRRNFGTFASLRGSKPGNHLRSLLMLCIKWTEDVGHRSQATADIKIPWIWSGVVHPNGLMLY